ncbi:MAG: type II toxin-antitoxin system PemK/MazF family toxin [bacterium]
MVKINNNGIIQPEEGEIVYFYYEEAKKRKLAVNLEPYNLHKHKETFNGVLITSQNVENIYPGDYELICDELHKDSKVICDQPVPLPKQEISKSFGNVSEKDLREIRIRAARSLGINYDGTTG